MKQKLITTHEAKTHLSKYLSQVSDGAEIIISRGKEPLAKLTKIEKGTPKYRRPKVGSITSTGIIHSQNCFDPLDSEELSIWGI